MPTFELKWQPDDPADSIILSFRGAWHKAISNQSISVAYRKKWPSNVNPKIMYAYLASPVSAIVARMQISWGSETLEQALSVSPESGHTVDEIRSYVGERDEIFVIRFDSINHAKSPITFQHLKDRYGFWPPSTFTPLSSFGVRTLDELGDFE